MLTVLVPGNPASRSPLYEQNKPIQTCPVSVGWLRFRCNAMCVFVCVPDGGGCDWIWSCGGPVLQNMHCESAFVV